MYTSTSKRLRGEENSGDELNLEKSSGEQDVPGNGDTEVFSTLIPLMKDVDVLKNCRLVCKSWNDFACRALRKLPRVSYLVYEPHLKDRLELLVANKNFRLPSPFGNFRVCAVNFREKPFLRFLEHVRDNANNYCYSVEFQISPNDEGVDPAELQNVLTSSLNNFKITKLSLSDKIIGSGPGAEDFLPEKIRLPYLESLDIDASVLENDKILNLCESICQFSPLKTLGICQCQAVEKLKRVMSTGGLKSVEIMHLNIEVDISPQDWEYICARIMEIPCIKKLETVLAQNCDEWIINALKRVIEHFANSLESLAVEILPMFINKRFPKLREISVEHLTYFHELYFPVDRYPLLKKATFSTPDDDGFEEPCVEELSLGIEELHLTNVGDFFYHAPHILKLICGVGMIFPNVSSFSIGQEGRAEFTSEILFAICKSFPKLTSLELLVKLKDDRILSGLRSFVDEWLQKGWPLEKIPRNASLLDFPGLEILSLGRDVVITKHLFMCCLSKMPKLQHLTFYANGDVTVTAVDVRDSVGHLKRITVLDCFTSSQMQCMKEMERLRVMLPTVVEIRKVAGEPVLVYPEQG